LFSPCSSTTNYNEFPFPTFSVTRSPKYEENALCLPYLIYQTDLGIQILKQHKYNRKSEITELKFLLIRLEKSNFIQEFKFQQCLVPDNLRICHSIKNAVDCNHLPPDTDSVQKRCWDNGTKCHKRNTRLRLLLTWTAITSITNSVACFHFSILLNCKLDCDHHVHYNVSQGLNILGLINYNTPSFTVTDSLMILYSTLLGSELQHVFLELHYTDPFI
jgi:hypothetical protein